ncbi:hypothetical protein [Plantactinospora endophytica]|uniref:hypothetical protein n=1 Tax=Plantactinospora endophytica TaxID=673535 RepID=UPI001943D5A7|nr:hypothetical protein [Plantactinospora endophytica]
MPSVLSTVVILLIEWGAGCGRVHDPSSALREAPSPYWAYLAGYLAVAACLARFGAEIVHGFVSGKAPEISWTFMTAFVVAMLLAGTLLPMALPHRWGRLFRGTSPTACSGVAGRPPGFAMTPVLGSCRCCGKQRSYTLYGAGLLVAPASYVGPTRPRVRGAPSAASPVGTVQDIGEGR